ncbi:hypothetical protein ASD78_07630 [Lysobacter sp. Root667]|nr:hypothetical protein ASD78_07630 [Lysobacter sp. Root667]
MFLMVALSMLAVAAIGIGLVRWKLTGTPSTRVANAEQRQVDALTKQIALDYRQNEGWSFLPSVPAARMTWLQQLIASQPGNQNTGPEERAWSSTLAYRFALLDAQGYRLAGVEPRRLLIALASIDTMRRDIVVEGRTVGFVAVAKPRDPDDGLTVAFLIQQQRNLAWLAGIAAALGALAAGLVAAGFRRPIRELVRGAGRLGEARFDTRLEVRRSDELGVLADTFNRLAARLESAEQARRQWVADTSHELRTPLSVLRAQTEALHDGIRPCTRENTALLMRQIDSLDKLIDDLYALARADVGQLPYVMAQVDPCGLVRDIWSGFAAKFDAIGLRTALAAPADRVRLRGDEDRLRQAIVNLLENSARYTDVGGRVELTCVATDGAFRLQLDDTAPGVPDSLIGRLGDRFFRVESSRNREHGGAGLGLALSRQIVEAHGGTLSFAPSPLGGLRAIVSLPLED